MNLVLELKTIDFIFLFLFYLEIGLIWYQGYNCYKPVTWCVTQVTYHTTLPQSHGHGRIEWKLLEQWYHATYLICYGTLWTLTIFIFLLFIFLISYQFCFSFLLILDDEEVCDTAVTWHVTWCDVIGLEHSGRIWKIISGHMYTTWWP